ncbi:MAG: hypothetical protein A2W08_13115 [Candidatus Rokubacteria bacterium RBG_16_73_20]|nr:MAG: hypothetical protein A2050_11945 [Candidatus Rokubacteria bacterium GWA2_73_35]OGK97108.1 MAG: hypothetical protein A2W08_13115 [Candidatus Rokubacteria bacterium RBG_16_73_20]
MNVEDDPGALAELARLGVPLVPAVLLGERAVHGWNPAAYAELLGVRYTAPPALPPAELGVRLDRILEATQRLLVPLDARQLDYTPPERARPLRDLAYHVFRLALAFVDGMDHGELPEGWLQERAPDDLRDGPAVARYGALVRGRIAGWFEGAAPGEFARVIGVYYGPQSGHELLERTAWHAAQHLRQLHVLVGRLGGVPAAPLPADAFAGLPLPDALW